MALISSQEKRDQSVFNSYFKKAKPSHIEYPIHMRVKSWVAYYEGDTTSAIAIATNNLSKIKSGHYMVNDLKEDISFFKKENN